MIKVKFLLNVIKCTYALPVHLTVYRARYKYLVSIRINAAITAFADPVQFAPKNRKRL